MGKATLILILGAGLYVTYSVMGTNETAQHTAALQAGYERHVLAREIARSGFNTAMQVLRSYGDDLHSGVLHVDTLTGSYQGGTYTIDANYLTGHSAEVIATGCYGRFMGESCVAVDSDGNVRYDDDGAPIAGASHVMADNLGDALGGTEYALPSTPLRAKTCGVLRARFLQSEAGYCSAVYLQSYPAEGDSGEEVPPEMLFAAGHNRTASAGEGDQLTVEKTVPAGTQMNFFIGVDKNCSTEPDDWQTYPVEDHTYDASDYDHLHFAFDLAGAGIEQMPESVWALVEQHPENNQRWRIGWEDQHRLEWDDPDSADPASSLQALKRFGYDGDGWPDKDDWNYRTLRDFGDRPDFSDQVIEVWLDTLDVDVEVDCNAPAGGATADGSATDDGAPSDDGSGTGGVGSGGTIDDGSGGATDDGAGGEAEAPCPCNTNKYAVMHTPPGNPGNAHIICVSKSGWLNGHKKEHDDYLVCKG